MSDFYVAHDIRPASDIVDVLIDIVHIAEQIVTYESG
jgi:hypothetical protein